MERQRTWLVGSGLLVAVFAAEFARRKRRFAIRKRWPL